MSTSRSAFGTAAVTMGCSKRATAREGRLGQLVQVNFTFAVASQDGTPLKVAPQSLQRIASDGIVCLILDIPDGPFI